MFTKTNRNSLQPHKLNNIATYRQNEKVPQLSKEKGLVIDRKDYNLKSLEIKREGIKTS